MESRKFYKGQIVEAVDLNDELGPDGTVETAIDNLQYDYEIDGIISGLVASQAATPDMTVDISTGVAYDGDGKRCKVSSGQNVDLSGVTLPGSGNEKYVSIYIENAKTTSEATIDDDDVHDYWVYADSFSITYSEGAEAPTGTATPPSLHATKRLIVDVLLYNGMTTITNSDLDHDRKEIAIWPSDRSSVDASGWTELSTDNTTVQEALTEIDGKLISRDGTGDIDQDLIPDGSVDLGSASDPWIEGHITDAYTETLHVDTKIEIESATVDIGDATDPLREIFTKKITLDTGGTPTQAFVYESAQSVSRYVNLAAGTVYSADNWTYYDNSGVQTWESVPAAARQDLAIPVNLPNGATVTDFDIQWYQSGSTTNNMTVSLIEVDNVGASGSKGGLTTPSGFGSYATDNANIVDFDIDNENKYYFFQIRSSDATVATCRVKNIKVNYTITNLLGQYGW